MELLRAWERRYNVVEPTRTFPATGSTTMRPSEATESDASGAFDQAGRRRMCAMHLRDLDDVAVETLLAQPSFDPQAPHDPHDGCCASMDRFLRDLGRGPRRGRFRADTRPESFARGSFEQVASELVMLALVALGEGWATGTVDAAARTAVSGAIWGGGSRHGLHGSRCPG